MRGRKFLGFLESEPKGWKWHRRIPAVTENGQYGYYFVINDPQNTELEAYWIVTQPQWGGYEISEAMKEAKKKVDLYNAQEWMEAS